MININKYSKWLGAAEIFVGCAMLWWWWGVSFLTLDVLRTAFTLLMYAEFIAMNTFLVMFMFWHEKRHLLFDKVGEMMGVLPTWKTKLSNNPLFRAVSFAIEEDRKRNPRRDDMGATRNDIGIRSEIICGSTRSVKCEIDGTEVISEGTAPKTSAPEISRNDKEDSENREDKEDKEDKEDIEDRAYREYREDRDEEKIHSMYGLSSIDKKMLDELTE